MDGSFGGATGATGSPIGTVGAMALEYVAFGPAANVGAAEMSVSPDTLTAYLRDMAGFTAWCQSRGALALPAAPDVVATYLTDLLRAGRRPKGVLRVGTAVNWVHRRAGQPAPWPSSRALLDALEELVPEAFVPETAGMRTWQEERYDVVELLAWVQRQVPSARRALEYVHGYIARGKHMDFTGIPVEERFDDRGDGVEAHTVCEICGHVVAVDAHATDAECQRHRCP